MRKILSISLALVLFAACTTIKEVPVKVNTRVLPLGDTVKLYDAAMIYSLPQTGFEFTVVARKTVQTAGPYHNYAEQFLGLKDVISEDRTIWEMEDVFIRSFTEPDPDHYYVVEADGLMENNAIAMTSAGLIMDAGSRPYSELTSLRHDYNHDESRRAAILDMGSDEYYDIEKDTAYKIIELDTAFVRIPYVLERKRELSLEEQAENTARILLELREGRHLILTGEANVFPQDKAAIDEINRLEDEYISLFAGKSGSTVKTFKFLLIPGEDMIEKPLILFRFSHEDGVLEVSDLSGRPVAVEIFPAGKVSGLDLVSSDNKLADGNYDKLYYRVPEIVDLRVTDGRTTLGKSRELVYQFGKLVCLPANYIIR